MLGSIMNVAVSAVTEPVRAVGHAVDMADSLLDGELNIKAAAELTKIAVQAEIVDEVADAIISNHRED